MKIDEIIHKVKREAATLETSSAPPDAENSPSYNDEISAIDTNKTKYHIREFLSLAPDSLVIAAYQAILKRSPDHAATALLDRLKSGEISPVQFIAGLRYSPEGKRQKVKITGLKLRCLYKRMQKLPMLGSVCTTVVAMARMGELKKRVVELSNRQHQIIQSLEQKAGRHELDSKAGRHELDSKAERHELDSKAERHELDSKAERKELQAYSEGVRYAERYFHYMHRELQQLLNCVVPTKGEEYPQESVVSRLQEIEESRYAKLYLDFEYRYRGNPAQVSQLLQPYAALIAELKPGVKGRALDLGCGRGEMVQFLTAQGFDARGVDLNVLAVDSAIDQGLDICHANAIEYLSTLEANSIGLISALHLVEHLHYLDLFLLLQRALRALSPGGVIILETPNPRNLFVGAGEFYRDFTHNRPVFPDTLAFLLDYFGFKDVEIYYFDEPESQTHARTLSNARNYQFNDLNAYINVSRDYAVVGTKP